MLIFYNIPHFNLILPKKEKQSYAISLLFSIFATFYTHYIIGNIEI